ncbi:hypothetical protein KJ785_04125 [Patescibacteria group bacterium]|nr:hypothetical protein [Patescibacteria group bacterium]
MSQIKRKAIELRRRVQQTRETVMGSWGKWDTGREWNRGVFHFLIGFTGWLLLQPIRISMWRLGIVVMVVGPIIFVFDRWRIFEVKKGLDKSSSASRFTHWISDKLCRDSERYQPANVVKSLGGFSTAWLLCWLAEAPWIAAAVCLIFSLVDPIAKLGMLWPIKKFKRGMAQGKSVGGLLFGTLGGIVGTGVIILLHFTYQPFFPPQIHPPAVCVIYLAGVVTASLVELVGGTWDNLLIPVSSSIVMVFLYMATMFF